MCFALFFLIKLFLKKKVSSLSGMPEHRSPYSLALDGNIGPPFLVFPFLVVDVDILKASNHLPILTVRN